jgi:glycosyltransferase involved in cell wall biosynthesis
MNNNTTGNDLSFIVFSDDWGEHPSSCQHIFKDIAEKHRVLWVNTIGMRNMQLTKTDLKKVWLKGRKMIFGEKRVVDGGAKPVQPTKLEVIQPLMLPFVTVPAIRWFNALSVKRRVLQALSRGGRGRSILVSTVPNVSDYLGCFEERKVVYYCVDDFTEWPGLLHEMVREMESALIEKSDCIITTSESLYDKFRKTGKPVHLLTHGVDINHFNTRLSTEHPLLGTIPKPRIGYFGLFDERSDQYLLRVLAENLPEVSIVITGDVVVDVADLEAFPNVYFTGPVSYSDLPSIVAGWEMCLLPYKNNIQTSSINPLKIKEYIATGLPVLSTPIPGVNELKEHIFLSSSSQEWVKKINENLILDDMNQKKDFLEILKHESWEFKVQDFLHYCS